MRTIKTGNNQCVVKEKITYYGIPQNDPRMVVIWLDGGGIVNTKFPDAETAKLNFDALDKIMKEDD